MQRPSFGQVEIEMSTPPVKEEDKRSHSSFITIRVQSQDGHELLFRMKRSSPLQLLMDGYCDKLAEDCGYFTFLFDGHILSGLQTPDELEMEDGDVIDAMRAQIGGASDSGRIR